MDLITFAIILAIVLGALFILSFILTILLWWFSGHSSKAKARRDWEF
jgi:regulatory protein YycH of two-component signal transduction system YycFG